MQPGGPVQGDWQHDLLRELGGAAMTPGTSVGSDGPAGGVAGGPALPGSAGAPVGAAGVPVEATPAPVEATLPPVDVTSAPAEASVWDTPVTTRVQPAVPDAAAAPVGTAPASAYSGHSAPLGHSGVAYPSGHSGAGYPPGPGGAVYPPGPGGAVYPPVPSAPPQTPDAAALRAGAPAAPAAPGPMPASGPMPAAGPLPASGPMPAAAPTPQPVPEPAPTPASQATPAAHVASASHATPAAHIASASHAPQAPHPTPPPPSTAAVTSAPVHTPTPVRRSGPTPVSVPLMPPELDALRSKPRHGESVAQRAGRAVRRAIASSPAAETASVTQTAYAIQQPVTTGRQISVSSIRGGAGKSTVAALLALTYAHYRADPVLAIEADPALGTLPHRLGAREVRWSGTDLAQIVDPSMLITDLTGYLIPFPGGGWLLPGSQGAIGTRLEIDTYRVVMTSLRRYFATTVVDCETLPAEVARTALVTTQARVLVSPATPEGVAATRSVLDWVGGLHPGMLPTTVVVLSHVSPDSGLDLRKATEHLGIGGATVLPLPYDRHLAAGGAIRTELLGERTLQAAARIAAEAMDRAVSRGPGRQRTGGAPR
ncbi:hypothetical protein HOK021_04640 [Streptomyces hygroscopicus]|nr:hypothetical protein HOK021_04640 [Streptomyces hygroscopicus]